MGRTNRRPEGAGGSYLSQKTELLLLGDDGAI